MRTVLLVDPIVGSHSLLYYKAALASTGFESTRFTLACLARDDADRVRLEQFAREEKRFSLKVLGTMRGQCIARWECWREFGRVVSRVETLLRAGSYDEVVYLYLDLALPFFGLPLLRNSLPSHAGANLAGLIFRDNGLRPPVANTLKARARSAIDRSLLRRGLSFRAFRRVAFLDHWCADRARALFNCSVCGYGVDPVFYEPCDMKAARAQFGLNPGDFVFLLFGTMSDRKAIVESLACLRSAPLAPEKTVIIVAGPVGPDYRARLAQEIAVTGAKYRVIHHDRFITQAEVPAYFAAADCVVCAYREFTGSSSVLLHGALYGKTALVSPGGAMEDAVRRHRFGEVADIQDRDAFMRAAVRLAGAGEPERQEMAGHARVYGQSMDARNFMAQFQ